jgi:hypothetical protein
MINEVNAFFRVEVNRTPPKDREAIFEDYLNAIAKIPVGHGQDMLEAATRLNWSDTYVQLHDCQRAMAELTKSETAFERWCNQFSNTEPYAVPHFQALICQKLQLLGDHTVRLQVAEQFLSILEQTGSGKIGTCCSTAAESAYALYQSTGDESYLRKYFSLHTRLEYFHEKESEDLCDLIIDRVRLISATISNFNDREKSLEWIDGFLEKYPHFSNPGELESLHRRRELLLSSLNRVDEARLAKEIADKYDASGPSLGKSLHQSISKVMAPVTSAAGTTKYDSEDEDEETYFNHAWQAVVFEPKRVTNKVVDFLLDWSFEDVLSGTLSVQAFQSILGISQYTLRRVLRAESAAQGSMIKDGAREQLHELLFPSDVQSEIAETARRKLVTDWLMKPPVGHRNERLFCLTMLHDARHHHFADKRLWELQIAELKHLIQLYDSLPSQIREFLPSQLSSWAVAIATARMVQVEELQGPLDIDMYALVLEAEEYFEKTIPMIRNEQPIQLAFVQRALAWICTFKIQWLQQELQQLSGEKEGAIQAHGTNSMSGQSEDVCDLEKEIGLLRKTALEKIREAEKSFTAREVEASWLDGLSGVAERQRLSEHHGSHKTIHIAMNLLLVEPKPPTQETITECWEWVQKYKARSLTRTIGFRSTVPPGLERQILGLPGAHRMHEEMVALQEEIEAAERTAKFDLRKRMDSHRQRMKEHPLLSRLIDLREGAPMSLSDIAAIESGAEEYLVLVDWFYLPPYRDNSEEPPKLLLFTARSDGTTTMDVLTTKVEDVIAWQREHLHPNKLSLPETRQQFDASLGSLVEPLGRRTNKGEVLVLCPTDILHSLPLHALHIRTRLPGENDEITEVLIHRNPVVYIHSHSLLRPCYSSVDNARSSDTGINPIFLAGISEQDATALRDGVQCDYRPGRKGIQDLAHLFGAKPMLDEGRFERATYERSLEVKASALPHTLQLEF